MVGNQLTIFALACKSAAKFGMATLTAAMPNGPINEPKQTTISATVVTGILCKNIDLGSG
ncbi:hypothetical protein GLIP_0095 [Aliiglaciecola lipolytica E3]|uniref:Uncharacterized protein n=1 Tax=Aliiglaciecola lipolytica E3 TaxID=1127673 RepID=K6YN32_9ALTE|nr:hypothetical protein GLIP_0095 [Aliiglaciecola lipolytica E3]